MLFALRGASHESVRRAAEDGLILLRGFKPEDMRDLVAAAMEPVLRPLVYAEPLHLVEQHRDRGEPVFIVSATLQEIVEGIADELGFDGALGTICEVRDGAYTGHAVRALHAENKATCIRELAEKHGFDLAECTAYSDSHTDLPFLEAVGHPVVVNPDRQLRQIAGERELADPRVRRAGVPARAATRAAARLGGSRAVPRRVRREQAALWRAEEALARLRALGFAEDDAQRLFAHFSDAEARGKPSHGFSRVEWLETMELDPAARPECVERRPGFERWHGRGALGYLVLDAVGQGPARRSAGGGARRRLRARLPDRNARRLGAPARRRRPRRGAHGDLAGPSWRIRTAARR